MASSFGGGGGGGSSAAALAPAQAASLPAAFAPGGGEQQVALVGVVPEPATWAMMIVGFGLSGLGLRRRRSALALIR